MAPEQPDAAEVGSRPAPQHESASRQELAVLARNVSSLRRDIGVANADGLRSAQALLEVEAQLAVAKARVVMLEETLAERTEDLETLTVRLARADGVMSAMKDSLSWRITAPLRALKRRA
jgi:hypothetical protein